VLTNESHITWNKIAHIYEDKFMELDYYNESYNDFLNSIHESPAHLLEIGCGPGNITKYLLNKRPDLKVFGIDVAPNMVDLARKNNPTAHFEVMDCRTISSLNEKFDAIVCGFCIPYLTKNETVDFIQDCAQLLNSDGCIYLSFVDGNPEDSAFQVGSSGDRIFFNFHKIETIEKLLTNAGFSAPKTIHVDYPKPNNSNEIHTVLISTKI
jgi:cyclopropane fatty-acyl-phospholipid synthase-like methyltransferase